MEQFGYTMQQDFQQMRMKDVEDIANSVDPDLTAPLGAVRSKSALFSQTLYPQFLEFSE